VPPDESDGVQVVSEAPMPQQACHPLFEGIMRGIQHMHACGYCHRDIKLENLLLKASLFLALPSTRCLESI